MITDQGVQTASFLLTNELVFTKLFTTKKNQIYLEHFLRDVLGVQVNSAVSEVSYNFQFFQEQYKKLRDNGIWLPIIEIVVELNEGHWIVLDLQKFPRNYLMQQVLYSGANYYQKKYQQISESQPAKRMFQGLTYLSILDFTYFKQKHQAIHNFQFSDKDTKESLCNTGIELTFFEIKKTIKGRFSDELKLRYWQELFTTATVSEDAPDYFQDIAELLKESNLTLEEAELAKKIMQSQEEFTEILDLIRANKDVLLKKHST